MSASPGADGERCAGCGRAIAGGAAACRAEFEAECGEHYGGSVAYPVHRLFVDAYALQHPDEYGESAKSLAAHLVGLLVWREHGGDPVALRALRAWLDGARALPRPAPPTARGTLTLADVLAGPPATRAAAIECWAVATWDAWAPLHATARRWLADALATRPGRC